MPIIPEPAEFEWDEGNSTKNLTKHGVSREECEQAFFNRPRLAYESPNFSGAEVRHFLLGATNAGRMLGIVFTIRNGKVRPISFRDMSRAERARFARETEGGPKK